MTGTVQFLHAFYKRVGDGESPIKQGNWKITLEFWSRTSLYLSRLWRVVHVTNLKEDRTLGCFCLSGWYRGKKPSRPYLG